jgi:hypothetical protein
VTQARAGVAQAVRQVQATQQALRERLSALQAKLEATPGDQTVKSQRDAVVGLLDQAVKREQELLLTSPTGDPVAVRERAEVPQAPAQPQPKRTVALGGLLGLVLAAGLAWWLAGRGQAPADGQARPTWSHPTPLPGARPAGLRGRLAGTLRSRLPKRRRAWPDTTPLPGVRSTHARQRLVGALRSQRSNGGTGFATVALTEEHDLLDGHRPTGNGFGKLGHDDGHRAEAGGAPELSTPAPTPDEPSGESPPW